MTESIKDLLASGAIVPDRPGSKRLVPAAKSVVVPVELLDGLRSDLANIASSLEDEGDRIYFGSTNDAELLREAHECVQELCFTSPAPSSLAGGEVRKPDEMTENALRSRAKALLKLKGWRAGDKIHIHGMIELLTQFGMDVSANPEEDRCNHPECGCDFDEVCDAALSPEALAREPMLQVIPDTSAEGCYRLETVPQAEVDAMVAAGKRVIAEALTPRHEAPSSHAFEASHSIQREGGCKVCGHDEASHEAPAEGAGEEKSPGQRAYERMRDHNDNAYRSMNSTAQWSGLTEDERRSWDEDAKDRPHLYGLRARSSAPEAREGSK